MSEDVAMAGALAEARAAFEADELVRDLPPGRPERRERMRQIIHAVAATWGVERMELTMALASNSARDAAGE
ncbi:hypothetical protein [Muricoccus pecuniae]|uniref:Uncharacterized protein n=1 Tax=Muricoccus pecuniae TaxID=693023 RepID=A0A840Y5E4_9PROT|nr:hypothetical protein [Roseomonas pecuniae]MBB5695366.1 hypothetical protein [Roseomonas pecuniae]